MSEVPQETEPQLGWGVPVGCGIPFFRPVLSEVGADGNDIVNYLEEFETKGWDGISRAKGFNKSMELQLFTESRFHKTDRRYSFYSPTWYISFKESLGYLYQYEDRVLDLLQRSITHELFGLSYWDLMEMDLPTFNKVRKRILDICDKQEKMRNNVDKQHKELEAQIQKGITH